MGYTNLVVTFILQSISLSHCFTISISGETYIEPGVPYKVMCNVSHFRENRKTSYNARIGNADQPIFIIDDITEGECVYTTKTGNAPCQSDLCSCDIDGLATHWIYNTPTDLSSSISFRCSSKNNAGYLSNSDLWIPTVPNGPGSNMSFNPVHESITQVLGQVLGPINCSAECNPPCQFHWIKPDGTVVDGSTLQIPRLSKNDHGTITCHAGNGYGNNGTKNLDVTVNYGPESVTLSPPTITYTVTEGDTLPSISCTASCRPQCTFMWTGPNVPGGTTNDLHLQNITRNQNGTFYCTATNNVGSKMSSNVEVDVRYQAKVENVDINTTNTVDENSTVKFSCLLEGNPAPTVTWSLNDKILQRTEGSTTKSSFIVSSARCNNTGGYICTASNIIGNSTKQQMLYVTCHPRNAIILDTTIAIKEKNATLIITVPIISYPHPNLINWTFIQNGTTHLIDVDKKYINTTLGVYQHVSQLIKDGLIESEYGTYSINVSNNIGPYFQHDFKVVAETLPDPPSNVSAVCDTSPFSTIISWRSEFDGGKTQTFHVWFKICCENVREFVAYSNEKSDPGRNKYVSVEITSLQAATPYIFYVSSSNDYGSSNSTKVLCNTTTESTRTDPSSAVVGIAAGTSSAIVVVIVVIVIVIIRRRFASDGGLKDNILYESAGPDFGRKPKSNGDEYAVGKKKVNTFHTNDDGTIRETALHAEDKKKPKRGNKGQIDSNTRKANGKDGMNEHKHEDAYENMEDKVGNERSTCQPMDNRNKDGIQYADLMFNPSSNGALFIIHGQDGKTIYADVNTTQKIDPLTDSDVEDDQNNSKSDKTAE